MLNLVHCVHLDRELELSLGEAKFYEDLDRAIRSALSDIRERLGADYLREEFRIIAPRSKTTVPTPGTPATDHDDAWLDQVFDRIMVPVLVAYDSPATATMIVSPTPAATTRTRFSTPWTSSPAAWTRQSPSPSSSFWFHGDQGRAAGSAGQGACPCLSTLARLTRSSPPRAS